MAAKKIINIIFLLIMAVTSLPVKQVSRCFLKKQAQEEMCDDGCDGLIKKAGEDPGFKEFLWCCHHYIAICPVVPVFQLHFNPANRRLPLCPAAEIHTPPPNRA